MLKKLNNFIQFLLTILGIIAIIELIRRGSDPSSTLDVSDLEKSIDEKNNILNQIDNQKVDIDEIIDKWNNK